MKFQLTHLKSGHTGTKSNVKFKHYNPTSGDILNAVLSSDGVRLETRYPMMYHQLVELAFDLRMEVSRNVQKHMSELKYVATFIL